MSISDLLYYKEGELYNKVNRGTKAKADCVVKGHLNNKNGYCYITIQGRTRSVHQCVWELHNGPVPKGMQIDHINRDKTDNRIENLRVVSPRDNQLNRKDNSPGFRKHRNKWQAFLTYYDRFVYMGVFNTKEEAQDAYNEFFNLLKEVE